MRGENGKRYRSVRCDGQRSANPQQCRAGYKTSTVGHWRVKPRVLWRSVRGGRWPLKNANQLYEASDRPYSKPPQGGTYHSPRSLPYREWRRKKKQPTHPKKKKQYILCFICWGVGGFGGRGAIYPPSLHFQIKKGGTKTEEALQIIIELAQEILDECAILKAREVVKSAQQRGMFVNGGTASGAFGKEETLKSESPKTVPR